jgi:carbon-monoxide dehydrogenase medium subunit
MAREASALYHSPRQGGAVKPRNFDYVRVKSLSEAVIALARHGADAKIIAGGQSLVPLLNMRMASPALLVDIGALAELKGISLAGGWLRIGALTRQAEAERSAEIARHAPLLALALPHIGHVAIRNRGTIGGSIALADPAAELPACLLALGGEVEIEGAKGSRTVKADDFFKDLYETALGPGDVLTAIRIPAAAKNTRVGFGELARRHGDFAMAGLAASRGGNGARLVFFGVGSTPVRAKKAEAALTKGAIEEAVAALDRDLDPPSDIHSSGAVKRHLAKTLLRRVAAELLN